jgi:hypothetical protein
MTVPTAAVSAAQVAQQQVQDQATQAPKQGPSAFDGHLEKARASATEAAQRMDHVKSVQQVDKADKTAFNKQNQNVNQATQAEKVGQQVSSKEAPNRSSGFLKSLIHGIEDGQKNIDKLLTTKNMKWDQQTLLQMQAGMYKYTQELELTGKVVEKATSGLKDTLKTQV